jgi:hypothetical protein
MVPGRGASQARKPIDSGCQNIYAMQSDALNALGALRENEYVHAR